MPNRVISLQHPGTGSPFPGVWIEKQIAMKRFFLLLFLGTCPAVSAQVRFSDYFLEETMRFDYYHSGDSRSEEYFFDALKAEPYWAGSHVSLLDTTGYGNQFFRIVDRASEREIYSRGFCTLFNEWQSTAEADSVRRSYPESVVFPYPRRPCRIEIFGRNARGRFEKRFSQNIDPASCFVAQFSPRYEAFEVAYNGNPAHRVDIVLLPEGYNIRDTEHNLRTMEEWLHAQPEVKTVSVTMGSTPPRYYLASSSVSLRPNFGNILVELHDKGQTEAVEARFNAYVRAMCPDVWLRSSLFKLSPVPDAAIEFGFIGDDIDTLRQFIGQSLPQLFSSIISIVSVFVSMIVLNVPLTLLTLVMVALMLFATKKIAGKSGKFFVRQQQDLGKVNGYIEEMMQGQKVVKVFNHEQAAIERFNELNEQLRDSSCRANSYANVLMPVNAQLGNVSYVLCVVAGAALALHGYVGLTLGTLAAFMTLNRSFNQPITQVSQQLNSVVMAMAGAERVFRLLDEKSETDEGYVTLINAVEHPDGTLTESEKRTGVWAWKHPHQADGTVTLCHSKTPDLADITRQADILVSAVGKVNCVTVDMVKDGAVVIDVAMNRNEAGKLCGDVDFAAVEPKASYITPVPGGVGPMTRAMLMRNILTAAEAHLK